MSKEMNKLLEVIYNSKKQTPDKIPKGWYCINDLVKKTGKSHNACYKYVHQAIVAGKLEQHKFYVTNNNHTSRVLFFKVKKSKTE